jgi:hypothetical protein
MSSFLRPAGEPTADSFRSKILPVREQAEVKNKWLKERLDKILPEVMAREGFDMWIIIPRPYIPDPVLATIVPEPMLTTVTFGTILVFNLRKDGSVERLALSRYNLGEYFEAFLNEKELTLRAEDDIYKRLERLVQERNPRTIGMNVSEHFPHGDGLTHSQYEKLAAALGPEYMTRTKGAERLSVGWLERRIQPEIDAYSGILEIAHAMIKEAFSSKVVLPGVTTTDDVVWWIRQKMRDMGLEAWFQPTVHIQAVGQTAPILGMIPWLQLAEGAKGMRTRILPGDLLHCDMGFTYLGLSTDEQQNAYVLRLGEDDAPEGLKAALAAGNRLQDIVTGEFVAGRTGNQINDAAKRKAESEGIKGMIYCHPIGFHGHGAGPPIGSAYKKGAISGAGDYPLFDDTCHSIELNVVKDVPEWGGQEVRMMLEEDAVYTGGKVHWLAGRQTKLHIIG